MVSESNHDEHESGKNADPYENLKRTYFHDTNGQVLIMNIANDFKDSNVIIAYDDGTIWEVKYVGKVLEFLNNTIQQMNSGLALAPVMAKWLNGELPVNINPQIEIPPHKIIDYVMQTIRKYPTKEYEKYVEEFGYFKILYDNCEIMQKFRKKPTPSKEVTD